MKRQMMIRKNSIALLFWVGVVGWFGGVTECVAQTSDSAFVRPPYLRAGDTVSVVAISSQLPKKCDTSFLQRFASWGLTVKLGEHLYCRDTMWFAGADTQRARDLQRALDDSTVKAVIFYKGGYGAIRTLDHLDLSGLRRHPKWLVGYSDITTMHYALRKIGVESIHGAMPVGFLDDTTRVDSSAQSLREALWGEVTAYRTEPHPFNTMGRTFGRLTGGNLSLIYAVNGTDLDNALEEPSVLLIEDVAEHIYHIDRMMQTLKRSGKLARAAAILVGHFTQITGEEQWGSSVEELIYEYTRDLGVPVIFGFPAGHEAPNYSLYMGRRVCVTVDSGGGLVEFL